MGKAAQLLYVSQPTLSKTLTRLEEEIGMPLFERQSTGMILTAVGKAYVKCAQRMIELNNLMDQEIKNITGMQPLIDVGLPMLRTEMMTRCIFPKLAREYPGMMVRFIHPPQSKLAVDLLNNKYAMGVGIITQKLQHMLNYQKVGEEEYVVVVPKGSFLEEKAQPVEGRRYPVIPTRYLEHITFVLSRPDAYSTRFARRYFEANGINPPIALTMPQTGTLIQAVAGNVGAALLPSLPLASMGLQDRVTYLCLEQEQEIMDIGLLYRKGYNLSKIEKRFIELMEEQYRY